MFGLSYLKMIGAIPLILMKEMVLLYCFICPFALTMKKLQGNRPTFGDFASFLFHGKDKISILKTRSNFF